MHRKRKKNEKKTKKKKKQNKNGIRNQILRVFNIATVSKA